MKNGKHTSKLWMLWSAIMLLAIPVVLVFATNDNGFGEIKITAAQHLDQNYNFISDIYDEVKDKDGVWSEVINSGEYVGARYEENLTNGNVIDVFVRGSGLFEVYVEGDNLNLLGSSGLIDSSGEWNYITLENVVEPTDVFDFKISGSLEFDYIHDAPSLSWVVLNSTSGTNLTSENLTVYTDQDDNSSLKLIYDWKKDSSSIAVLNMPFEGGSNSTFTKDYSDFGNNGGAVGAIWNLASGYDGNGAYEFNTDDSVIKLGSPEELNFSNGGSFTISARIKSDVADESFFRYIVSKYDFGNNNRAVALLKHPTDETLRFYIDSDGTSGVECSLSSSANNLNDTDWHFVAGVFDDENNEMFLYLDGALENSISCNLNPYDSAAEWLIGGIHDSGDISNVFDGIIDEVMIFNYSLSPEQISALYNNRTDLIVSQETTYGEIWDVVATPNDGTSAGTSVLSNNLTIQSLSIVLNSTLGTNLTTENLTAYPSAVGDEKLIYNWRKDGSSIAVLNMPFEGGSNATFTRDYSNNANGTVSEATFQSTGGYDGKGAYGFNPSDNSYIELGNPEELNFSGGGSFSISAWIKADVADESFFRYIVSKYDFGNNNRAIALLKHSDETLRFYVDSDGTSGIECLLSSGSNILNNVNWHFVAGVFDDENDEMSLYFDGVLKNNISCSLNPYDSSANWAIGTTYNSGSVTSTFNGTIDEVMIFDRALSPEQISAIYNNRTDLIVSQETRGGDVWSVEATPNDGTQDGTSVLSSNLTVLSSNNPPNITLVNSIVDVTLTPFTVKDVYVLMNVSDEDGYGDLNDTLAWCAFSKTGEATRNSTSCVAQDQSGNDLAYNCLVDMYFYDAAGLWNVECYVEDINGVSDTDSSKTFIVNNLHYVTQDVQSLNWTGLLPGNEDKETESPLILTNGGNQDYTNVNITSYNATNNSDIIPSNKFMIDSQSGQTSGQTYLSSSGADWAEGYLPRCNSPCSSNSTEVAYFYVDMPTGILAGVYASITDWTISLS